MVFFCVAQSGLKLTATLLPQIPEYWTYRYTLQCWAVFLALYSHLVTESHPFVSGSPYPVFILNPHQHTFGKYSSLSAPFVSRLAILSAHPGQIHPPLTLYVWSGTLHLTWTLPSQSLCPLSSFPGLPIPVFTVALVFLLLFNFGIFAYEVSFPKRCYTPAYPTSFSVWHLPARL